MPLQTDMRAARGMLNEITPDGTPAGPVGQLSPRQQLLDHLWSYFRCSTYDAWAYDWDGNANPDSPTEHDNIARSGAVPDGFLDVGSSAAPVPLKFRKPSAPYYLGRVIVQRFTSLLFSSKRHPKPVSDDPVTEDWLIGFAAATRLWAQMIQARNFGGAMGASGLGFKFAHGKPQVEVHDPRWCFPEFQDRDGLVLSRLEVRYQYTEPQRDPTTGDLIDAWYWYRRVLDTETDTVWPKVQVDEEGREPNWKRERCLQEQHGYGFVPCVWIQNQPVQDDVDGDPDCHGCFDLIRRIDQLYSQADKGVIANCDPTLVISSNAEIDGVSKGSNGLGLQLEAAGKAQYLEMTGDGTDKAVALAEKFEEKALTIARCVLDDQAADGAPAKTATEIDKNYSSMAEQADILREQYGEHGVKRLLEMVLRAARMLGGTRSELQADGTTKLVRQVITLPKRRDKDPKTGKVTWVARELGEGEQVELTWPDYFTKSDAAISAKVDAAGKAKTFGIIPTKAATEFVAQEFQIENIPEAVATAQAEAKAAMGLPDSGSGNDLSEKVAQRTEQGAKSPLPNPTARLLRRF